MPPRDDSASALPPLSAEERRRLARQRRVGRILAPLWVPLTAAAMRFVMGWRIENARELPLRAIAKAGFGFGDVNAVVVFGRWNP